MRRLVLVVALLLSSVVATAQPTWKSVEDKIRLSVVKMSVVGRGHCTAFAINQAERLYFTAEHCLVGDLTIDEKPATVIKKSDETDLAIVKGMFGRFPLKPAENVPAEGEHVGGMGYSLSLPFPMFLVRTITVPATEELEGFLFNPNTIMDGLFVLGMSGGPVVNVKGEVVTMVQQGSMEYHVATGRTISAMKQFAGSLWNW